MLAEFTDLPLELLPAIFETIRRPSTLATICLVSRTFYNFTIPLLYERIFIYPWQKEGKRKVSRVFRTLAESPRLAAHVLRLDQEVREFPRGLKSDEHDALIGLCLQGIENCTNLANCTWTRDGSLTSEVLRRLQLAPSLRTLTINGHHDWHYEADILRDFTALQSFSVIMPSIEVLRTIASCTFPSLLSLTLVCKSTSWVTDEYLRELSSRVSGLQRLHLAGCPRVTDEGISALLHGNTCGFRDLAFETLSAAFDLQRFLTFCRDTNSLTNLRSITLTTPGNVIEGGHNEGGLIRWCSAVGELLALAPLERLQVYCAGEVATTILPDSFCYNVVAAHAARLTRFSIHRIGVSLAAIEHVCRSCLLLEELFIAIKYDDLASFGPAVVHAEQLRTIHVNITDQASSGVPVFVAKPAATEVMRACGPNVFQIGFNTRVYQVMHHVLRTADGSMVVERTLGPYEFPDVPEQFLVVRT